MASSLVLFLHFKFLVKMLKKCQIKDCGFFFVCKNPHICRRRPGPSSRWEMSRIHSRWGCCTEWIWRCGHYAPPPVEGSRAQVRVCISNTFILKNKQNSQPTVKEIPANKLKHSVCRYHNYVVNTVYKNKDGLQYQFPFSSVFCAQV